MITAPSKIQLIIIHGPQGCGKRRNADRFKAHFGADAVFDEDSTAIDITKRIIFLTNAPPPFESSDDMQILSYEEALALSAPVDRAT